MSKSSVNIIKKQHHTDDTSIDQTLSITQNSREIDVSAQVHFDYDNFVCMEKCLASVIDYLTNNKDGLTDKEEKFNTECQETLLKVVGLLDYIDSMPTLQ